MSDYTGTIVAQAATRPAVRKHEYAITALLSVLFVSHLAIAFTHDHRALDFWYVALFFVCMAYAVGLSFESWTRVSRFRLSRNHPLLDKILSIANVVLPFLYIFFGLIPLIASSLLMSYSYHTSPDRPEQRTADHFRKRFYYFLLNSIFLSLIQLSTGVLV